MKKGPWYQYYSPRDKMTWLVAAHAALSVEPYTNKRRLEALEKHMGYVVADFWPF